jgi:hypothetical protein
MCCIHLNRRNQFQTSSIVTESFLVLQHLLATSQALIPQELPTCSTSSNSIMISACFLSATSCSIFMYLTLGCCWLRRALAFPASASSIKSYSSLRPSSSRFRPSKASDASTVEDLKDLRKSSNAPGSRVSLCIVCALGVLYFVAQCS